MTTKGKHIAPALILVSLLSLPFLVSAQEEENQGMQDTGPVIVDNVPPEPAPVYSSDVVPTLDKDSIHLRLKKLQKSKELNIPMTYNNTVFSFIHYFTVRNREYSKMILSRKDLYFATFERILAEYGMPDELKYLSIVESGLNPRARSRAGAVGLWQFVSKTGQYYKLNNDWYIDERQDPEKSTRAACEYLKYLYQRFGQWELALAAYNCGPTSVSRAIKNSRHRKDFWEIYYHLPRETRSYVPQFIAVVYLMNHNKEHNLFPEYFENAPNYLTVYTEQYVNLETLAKQLDICVDELQKLNPVLLKNIIPAYAKNFPLKIPAEKYHLLMENYCTIMDSCSKMGNEEIIVNINPFSENQLERKSVVHLVRRGDVLNKIAKKYHVSVSELKKWNHLSSNRLRFGQKLTIWREGYQKNEDKSQLAKTATPHKQVKNPKNVYYVQPGDTLWSISQKTDAPIDQIKKINRLKGNELKPGQKLILS